MKMRRWREIDFLAKQIAIRSGCVTLVVSWRPSYSKFEIIQLQEEELAAKFNVSRKMLYIL